MISEVIQVRVKNSHKAKLEELTEKLGTRDASKTIRACIDIAHTTLCEPEAYLINFYDLKSSLLYKWINKEKKHAKR